jgi:hypothetical protein
VPALTGPVLLAAALLVAAGAPKVARPATATGALRSVGIRVPSLAVRGLGAGEAAVGALAIVAGGRLATALVAASYAGFTAFVAVALRTGGAVASCGCVGRADTPPTRAHLIVTGALALLTAAAAATGQAAGLVDLLPAAPGETAVTVALAGVGCWLAWLALAELPRLRPART